MKTTAHGCVIFGLLAFVGCQKAPSRWDQAQNDSEGKTAQEASADRIDAVPGEDQSAGTEPPPYTPGKPASSGGPVTWKPKGTGETNEAAAIDLEALTSGDPLPGGEFNKFFPEQSGNDDMVAKQEKQGFAQSGTQTVARQLITRAVSEI